MWIQAARQTDRSNRMRWRRAGQGGFATCCFALGLPDASAKQQAKKDNSHRR
jgi:hypothetical protein